MQDHKLSADRRSFLGSAAAAAAALGLDTLIAPSQAAESESPPAAGSVAAGFQAWLNSITGKHRQVYDMPEVNNGFGLIWSHVYLLTGVQSYGVPEKDLGVVVVLRHAAIPIAFNDAQWTKYKLGEVFKVNDPATKAPATRNPFTNVKPGDLPFPEAALDRLVARGVKFGVCAMAMTFYSGMVARQAGIDAHAVMQDWTGGVLPGVQIVPSGVVAVNGAQAHGCSYCFAG
jgi:intracellular sulfur oxidation DsrE/DsrF family protein